MTETEFNGIAVRLVNRTLARDAQLPDTALSREIIALLEQGPIALSRIDAEYGDHLIDAYLNLQKLWKVKALEVLNKANDPDIILAPATTGETLNFSAWKATGLWKLSRFAYVHRTEDGNLILESPRATAITTLLSARAVGILFGLRRPTTVQQMKENGWGGSPDELNDLLVLLHMADCADCCDAKGNIVEDERPDLMQWEFHDLLFHCRSRQGRHDSPMGAHFRFKGQIAHEPVVKPNPWRSHAIALYRPTLAEIISKDAPFSSVLEARRSNRDHNDSWPISVHQLGEFLFRTSRIRHRFQTDIGEFTSRPYPSGGASYELELYITVNHCAGLDRGFYYYDPEAHSVCLVQRPNDDVEGLLNEAWQSAAQLCRPQVLITVASRFHRLSWKYSGMAYATQLKNTGVLYQTLYLVATAMNLAGCGLGCGNTSRFCRLAGTSYLEEGSIGEFMLGNPS